MEEELSPAQKQIAQLLQTPDQLSQVPQLLKNFSTKKNNLEIELKAVVQTQLEEVKDGLMNLNESVNLASGINQNFRKINELCRECQELIDDYSLIKQIDTARTNLFETIKELDQFLKIPERCRFLIQTLEISNTSLLPIYMELRKLQFGRDKAFEIAKQTNSLQAIKLGYVELENLSNAFESKLWYLSKKVLYFAEHSPMVLLALLQVIEREEKYDQLLKKQMISEKLDPLDSKNFQKFKRYKDQFFQNVRDSISDRFDIVLKLDDLNLNMTERFEGASRLLHDLTVVLDDVVPCFPPSYNILDFFIHEYHIRWNTTMIFFANTETQVPARDIINLIAWVKKVYEKSLIKLGKSNIQPNLLDTLDPLYTVYTSHIRKLMEGWIETIIETDRDNAPDIVEGQYITLGPNILWNDVIQTQIEIALTADDSKFMYGCLFECGACISIYQRKITQVLNQNWQNLEIEYIAACINNNYKNGIKVEELVEQVSETLDEKRANEFRHLYENLSSGFHILSEKALTIATDYVWEDIKPIVTEFFTKVWLEKKLVETMILTFEDYFGDLRKGLLDAHFNKIVFNLLQRVVFGYVVQIFSAKVTTNQKAIEKIIDDTKIIKNYFEKYLKPKFVENSITILTEITSILKEDYEYITLYFGSLLKVAPDMTSEHMNFLLGLRGDLKRSQIHECVQGCKTVLQKESQILLENKKKFDPFFSKIPIPVIKFF